MAKHSNLDSFSSLLKVEPLVLLKRGCSSPVFCSQPGKEPALLWSHVARSPVLTDPLDSRIKARHC